MIKISGPRLRTPVLYILLCLGMLVLAWYRDEQNPAAPLVPLLCAGIAVVFFAAAIVSFWDWIQWRILEVDREWREVDSITPRLRLINAAAHLTPEQAKVAGMADFKAALGITAGDDGPLWWVITHTGLVPIEFADDFLRQSGAINLKPVREYSDKTPGREYATSMTDWCVTMGLATPASGSNPAQWIDDNARARAFRMLKLDLELKD